MRESVDDIIRKTIWKQVPPLPDSYEKKLNEILENLPEEKRAEWGHIRAAVVIVACVLVTTTTAVAAVSKYHQRLSGMSMGKIESLTKRSTAARSR